MLHHALTLSTQSWN